MNNYFYETNKETIDKIQEVDKMISEEKESANCDYDKITRLMYEQMLRGLYLNNFM